MPVPLVPELPLVPEVIPGELVPEVPLVPVADVPEVPPPDVPLVPLVPEVPAEPEEPENKQIPCAVTTIPPVTETVVAQIFVSLPVNDIGPTVPPSLQSTYV
jgi:peroxidase